MATHIKPGFVFIPHLEDAPADCTGGELPYQAPYDAQFLGGWGIFYRLASNHINGCEPVPYSEYLNY